MTLSRTNLMIVDRQSLERKDFQYFTPPQFLHDRINEDIDMVLNENKNALDERGVLFKDALKLSYLIILQEQYKCIIILGPFLDERIILKDIQVFGHAMKLSSENIRILENLYSKLSYYEADEIENIHTLIRTLLDNTLLKTDIVKMSYHGRLSMKEDFSNKFRQYDFAEKNYAREHLMLNAVKRGDTDYIHHFLNQDMGNISLPARGQYTPLRHWKNLTITLNSICARAAYSGGLSPHLVHSISSKYAIEVEKLISYHNVTQLTNRIVMEYTESVSKFSLTGYSPLVKKAIRYIRNNLTEPICLLDISEELNVSESHLARIFKKEMGQTVTAFIQESKIGECLELVKSGSYSMTDIAFMFGFSSSSYFSSVFNKVMGISPRKYHKLSMEEGG